MKPFWEERYGALDYAYGTAPNTFIAEFIDHRQPGKILFPAEGEGRNAVYAAQRGWIVDAFDYSDNARKKALELAAQRQVTIHYQVADVQSFAYHPAAYDAVGLCYAHLPPDQRRHLHRMAAAALKPGGEIVLEAFAKSQLLFQSGGPRREDMLYSVEELQEDWPGLEFQLLQSLTVDLSEGHYHQGKAAIIRMIAKKPTI